MTTSRPDGQRPTLTCVDVSQLLAETRRHLASAPQEALGELVTPRRMLGFARAPRIVPRGSAWHLGALLVTDDGVAATGEIVRAREEVRRGFPAESQRRRAELSAAARRGGFAEGQVVHIGWQPIDAASVTADGALLAERSGVPSIRWSSAGAYMPLDRYLGERVELLLNPSAGSS